MFCKKKEDEIRLLKEEVDQLKSELRKEKERNRKKKIGYREKCLKKAIEMAEKLGFEIPQKIKRF